MSEVMGMLGRLSGAKLTKAQRKERAKKAARARWEKRKGSR
jgi:hypothetical protein